MASPSVSVGDDARIAATATASAAPKSTCASGSGGEEGASSTFDQASTSQECPKPVSSETSLATSEAPSSNSANDDDDEDDGNHRSTDGDEVQGVDEQKKPSTDKKRKMVKRSREERLEMNRMTARERRRKAKVLVDNLQERVNELTRHNEALRRDNTLIRAQLQAVTTQNGQTASGSEGLPTYPNRTVGTISSNAAVSSSPSPTAAPASSISTNANDSGIAASLIRQLQQQANGLSSLANPSPGLQQIAQAPAAANATAASVAVQQQALRMLLGLQSPQVPTANGSMGTTGTSAYGATNVAVPGTINLAPAATSAATATPSLQLAPSPSDLAVSALSAYQQQQQQPSQGILSVAPPAQINPQQYVANKAVSTAILQNLGLLGGTGALPPSQPVSAAVTTANNAAASAALSCLNVVQGASNANGSALAQLLPALQQQQQQQQQGQPPNTRGPSSK